MKSGTSTLVHRKSESIGDRIRRHLKRARVVAREPGTIALGVVVLAGLILRIYLFERWRPGFVGFPDTTIYVEDARTGIFNNPLRVGGYSEFLRLMHGIRPHLSFAILVQHMLGLASGLLLYGAVSRAGLPKKLGLVPAAVVILGGSELFIEHAPLTEAMFVFFVDLSLYALVRAWRGRWSWSVLAGLTLGAAADVRTVGLVLIVGLIPVLLFVFAGPWRARFLRVALVVVAMALPLGSFLEVHEDAVGYGGFTGASYFDLYARVAPFAECSKFRPPAGTSKLCIDTPRSKRDGHDVWEFTGISPAVRLFGEPDQTVPQPGENSKLSSFARAAILGQPGDYLEAVGRDLVRIVDPSFASSSYVGNLGYGNTPESMTAYYFDTANLPNIQRVLGEYYPGDGQVNENIGILRSYERDTRLEGPLMALLLLLAVAAPILTTADNRRASLLFFVATVILLTAPVFASEYDYRFTIPAFGSLAATAAIGAWALGSRVVVASELAMRHARGYQASRTP
jgi:4-amino-4-deoxy-L-arabinose transferase-like glycosyltransferase